MRRKAGCELLEKFEECSCFKNAKEILILTGSTAEGRVMPGRTCGDWTSDASDMQAQVGHSDGLGPGGDPSGRYSVWNSSHENGSCADTSPRGGAGRIYCFFSEMRRKSTG